ncbi:MAG: InlB B-repeat-containing protein [Micrococcales bacterium]
MKKILVALATAALTFTGLASPAHAAVVSSGNASTYISVSANSNNRVFTVTCLAGNWGGTIGTAPASYIAMTNYGTVQANTASLNGAVLVSSPLTGSSFTLTQSYNAGLISYSGWELWFNNTSVTCGGNTFSSSVFIPVSLTLPTYSVTFDANGATGSVSAVTGSGALTMPTDSGLSYPGYNFTGWNTVFDGSGTAVAAGSSYTPSTNETLYAQWVQAAQTVTYDANTGSGSITASVANGARNLSDGAGFTKPGYTFSGWNTAANGTGTAIAASASYTPSGNVTLYAQWTRIPTPPAPVFTSPIAVAGNGGLLSLNGANLAGVTSVTVDEQPATISTASNGQVTVSLPTLAPGRYDITIKNADGAIRFIDGLVVPDPNAKVAEKPTTTYVAASAIKVSGSTPTAKQAAALTAFVAQYKNAKQATVYIRTSKAGLTAAK